MKLLMELSAFKQQLLTTVIFIIINLSIADYYMGTYMNSFGNDNEKSILNVALAAILKELDTIKKEKDATLQKQHLVEGNCKLDGEWFSKTMDIGLIMDRTEHGNLIIKRSNRNQIRRDYPSILKHDQWLFKGEAPFKEGNPFLLTAVNMNISSVATFTGVCTVVNGKEQITGIWMIGTKSNNWLDSFTAQKIVADTLSRITAENKIEKINECQNTIKLKNTYLA